MGPCERERLSRYVDGEVTDHQVMEVEAHLAVCRSCREEVEGLRSLKMLLAGLQVLASPARIRERVRGAAGKVCQQLRPLIIAYMDGELEEAGQEALALHLGLCQGCREELAAYRQLRSAVAAAPVVSSPSQVRWKVEEALAQRGRRTRKVALGPALAGAALAAVSALVWLYPGAGPAPDRAVAPAAELRASKEPSPLPQKETLVAGVGESSSASATETKGAAQAAPQIVSKPRRSAFRARRSARARMVAAVVKGSEPQAPATASPSKEVAKSAPVSYSGGPMTEVAADNASAPAGSRATVPASATSNAAGASEAPTEIAAARGEMLRASERYQALRMESLLNRLPKLEEIKNKKTNGNPPGREPGAWLPGRTAVS